MTQRLRIENTSVLKIIVGSFGFFLFSLLLIGPIFYLVWPIFISYSGTGLFHQPDLKTLNINSTNSIGQWTNFPDFTCIEFRTDKFRINYSNNQFEDMVYEFETKHKDNSWLIWYKTGWSSMLSVDLDFSVPDFTYDRISTKYEGFNAIIKYKNHPSDPWKPYATLNHLNEVQCYQASDPLDFSLWRCSLSVFKLNNLLYGKIYQLSVQLPKQARPASANYADNPSTMTDIELTTVKERKCIFTLNFRPLLLPMLVLVACIYLRLMTVRPRLSLLENTICFGIILLILNGDIEYLWTLIQFPWIFLWMDLKKIILNGGLMLFMIIFVGEHNVNDEKPQRVRDLRDYRRSSIAVALGSCLVFLYHAYENEYRAWNPFSIIEGLTDPFPTPLIVVIVLAVIYLIYLAIIIGQAINGLNKKKKALPGVIKSDQELSNHVICNIKFIMFATMHCAVLTVLDYVFLKISQALKATECGFTFNYSSEGNIINCLIWISYFGAISYLYSPEVAVWSRLKFRFIETVKDEKKVSPISDTPAFKRLI